MPLPAPFTDWFAARGWRLWRHQADMLAAGERGEHALLVAATGAGKTLSGFLPSLVDIARHPSDRLHTLRSEEHTSELQSLIRTPYAVFCLKKKKTLSTRHQSETLL